MALVKVTDHVIWTKYVLGTDGLAERIDKLKAGDLIMLSVEGFSGPWIKMNDQPNGSPTPGIKPVGHSKTHWAGIYAAGKQKGSVVNVSTAA